jgi:hypothetical protein
MTMKKRTMWWCLLSLALLVLGWNMLPSEPSYGGLSIEGFNYTPYNLDRFRITDKYGNTAGGGGDLMPGSGQGSLSCCYKLKGTDFTVDWYVYDADLAIKAIAAQQPIQDIHKITEVHLPPTKAPGSIGGRVLGLHFYPDDHIEFEFRDDLQGTRIEYADVWDWLRKHHNPLINPDNEDDSIVFRKTARLAARAWVKYHLADTGDLQQYVYFTLLNPKFDEHPAIQKIISETKDKPGAFGAAMEALPASMVEALKIEQFNHPQTGATHG